MRKLARTGALILALALAPVAVRPASAGDAARLHRLAIQVDQDDPAVMTLALANADNVIAFYRGLEEPVQVEIVAYGPGLRMFRDDTSPVKDRIRHLVEDARTAVTFTACGNTKAGMEKREGKPITLIPQATVVPAGVVRLMQLQEQGWSYVRP